jgi:uncharacterized protein (TIGR02391 family)
MILTDKEMDQVRRALELQAGLDEELMRRCGHLIHLGAFDEAVRSAFVLLEERLRQSVGQERMTGTQLANFAFSPSKGPLSRQLGHSPSEKEGLRELYSGAFKLFRNPTAHGVVEYSAAEGKAIIGLVDLLLRLLKRAEELPPPGLLPENLEIALAKVEEAIGPGASSRLHNFLGKCVSELGLKPSANAKQWIPFKKHALYKASHWDAAKPHTVAAFYLVVTGKRRELYFPINQYHNAIEGFNTDQLTEQLLDLGFYPKGSKQEPSVDLRVHNDREFFDVLFDIVSWMTDEFQETLK